MQISFWVWAQTVRDGVTMYDMEGLTQDRSISNVLAIELIKSFSDVPTITHFA